MPPLTLDGTNGVSAVQAGAVESGDLPAGSVIQVVSTTKTDTFSQSVPSSSTLAQPSGYQVNITPKDANSKILVIASFNWTCDANNQIVNAAILKNGTAVCIGDSAGNRQRRTVNRSSATGLSNTRHTSVSFLDSPNTTGSIEYSIGLSADQSTIVFLNRSSGDNDATFETRSASTITAMEIAG